MSILRAGNREWWLYIFVGAVLTALCFAVVYLEPVTPSSSSGAGSTSATGSADLLEQAPWRIRIHPAGLTRRMNPRSKTHLQAQEKQLQDLVRETYDALFLDHARLVGVVDRRFVPQAGSAFLKSRAGFPQDATRIKTTLRRARIGIEASNARHGAGQVVIAARARVAGSLIRIRQRSTLWLRRERGAWKVVAFELDQKRVR